MIKIIENVVSNSYQNAIADLVMDYNFEWVFQEATIAQSKNGEKLDGDSIQFCSSMFNKHNNSTSRYGDFIKPLIFSFQDSFNLDVKEVIRVKFNLTLNNTKIINHPPHVDTFEEGYVSVVYYVHDCDGETFIYDKVLKTQDRSKFYSGGFSSKNLNVIESVAPKKGTAVMFNSNRLHSSSNPVVASRRIVLNCIFKV